MAGKETKQNRTIQGSGQSLALDVVWFGHLDTRHEQRIQGRQKKSTDDVDAVDSSGLSLFQQFYAALALCTHHSHSVAQEQRSICSFLQACLYGVIPCLTFIFQSLGLNGQQPWRSQCSSAQTLPYRHWLCATGIARPCKMAT